MALLAVLSLVAAACGDADDTGDDGLAGDAEASDEGGDDEDAADDGGEAGTAAETFDRFNSMEPGEERTQALIEGAEQEGALTLYTASSGMQPVIDAFMDKYDIEVELFRAGSAAALQRVIQEYQAGYYAVDVYDDAEAPVAVQEELTHEYVNEELTSEVAGYVREDHVLPTRLAVFLSGWNTDLAENIPDTIEGWTDPRWDGRLGIEGDDWQWYLGLHDYYVEEQGWSTEEVDEMMCTMLSHGSYHSGHTTTAQLMLAGEFAASPTLYPQSVARELEADSDAPVAWRKEDGSWVEPLIYQPEGVVLMKNAPHPHAALLWMDFMAVEGQEVLGQQDPTPTANPQPGGELEDVPEDALHRIPQDPFLNNREEWQQRWDDLAAANC